MSALADPTTTKGGVGIGIGVLEGVVEKEGNEGLLGLGEKWLLLGD